MKNTIIAVLAATALSFTAMAQNSNFNYSVDRFADIEVSATKCPDSRISGLQQKELRLLPYRGCP